MHASVLVNTLPKKLEEKVQVIRFASLGCMAGDDGLSLPSCPPARSIGTYTGCFVFTTSPWRLQGSMQALLVHVPVHAQRRSSHRGGATRV